MTRDVIPLVVREKTQVRLALSTFFPARFTTLLLVSIISSFAGFVASCDKYHSRGVILGFNKSSAIDTTPLSSLWAAYSPYHPAGEYEGSIREGRALTQVDIVSLLSLGV